LRKNLVRLPKEYLHFNLWL